MKIWTKILLIICIIFLFFVIRLLFNAGTFTKISPYFNGKITEINGFEGGEDITIDQETGLAYVSSNDFNNKNASNGVIYVINLNDPHPIPINLTDTLHLSDFHPHGISLLKTSSGQKILFVVNHEKSSNSIKKFEILNHKLTLLESITDPLIISPNDIVGITENTFYVTNDHDEPLTEWRAKKDLMQIAMGNVCYFDGKKAKIVTDGLLYANGINKSLDGKKIFVAATTGKEIRVFDREIASGNLHQIDAIEIRGADNIEMDEQDNLWVGCHPKLLAFLDHSKDHNLLSPSQIIKIEYKNATNKNLKSIYLNDGRPVSGSSVGAVYENKLLIGTVFENKILFGTMAE